jgi:SpoIIAA-like
MPMVIDIDKAAELITATVRGRISFDDLRAALAALFEDPDFDSGFNRLWDLREARPLLLSDKVRAKVRVVRDLLGGRRTAIVASSKDAELARMYRLFVEDIETQVFHNKEDAVAWLGAQRGSHPPCK